MRPSFPRCLLLCALLGACGATDEGESEFVVAERLAVDFVRQYLEYYCDCYGEILGFADAATCVEVESTRFPLSSCDAVFSPSSDPESEDATLDYLGCLIGSASRGAFCLVGCDAELILNCEAAFSTLDEDHCAVLLTETQREALRSCRR